MWRARRQSGMRGLRALLVVAAGLAAGPAKAGADQGYADLRGAVLDGKDIRVTLDLAQCLVHGTDRSGPPVRGSVHFDAYMVTSDESIAFSMTHFTVRTDGTPVEEFLSFKVEPSGRIDAHSRFFNAATFSQFQESEFDCDIGKGARFHWQ